MEETRGEKKRRQKKIKFPKIGASFLFSFLFSFCALPNITAELNYIQQEMLRREWSGPAIPFRSVFFYTKNVRSIYEESDAQPGTTDNSNQGGERRKRTRKKEQS